MGEQVTLILRGGAVVDGTGRPPFEADVALAGSRIAAIGAVPPSGAEEIDARGLLVTPGFVDVHTHYDGQAVWDSRMTPSSWHGVTTAVMGNCGVGFAPVREQDRQRLVELMEGVEDIPAPCLHEGLDWQWESFGSYLDALDRNPRDIDLCAQLPHAALRIFVMGERASRLEAATPEDSAEMRRLTAEAMRAGALGFSTSRTIGHRTLKGDRAPSLRATEDELTAIACGMSDAGHGFMELVSDWDTPDAATEFAMLRRVLSVSRRPLLFSMAERHDKPQLWRELLAMTHDAVAQGLSIRPVIPPRPIGILFGLHGTQNPFSATPSYRAIADLPVAERVAVMRDPEVRRRILSEDPVTGSTFPLLTRLGHERMFLFSDPPNYTPDRENSLASIAAREGRSAPEVAYDLLTADEGRNFIFAALVNYAGYTLDPCREMLADPVTLVGLGDGGAHVGFVSDGSFPTFLLSYWGRDRGDGTFPIEELIRRHTSDTAAAVGLNDRGVLAPGLLADVNLLDLDRLRLGAPYMVHDLPAGGRRLMQRADGYAATIKSGSVTYRNGEHTGALPGRLVRGPQAGWS
ncbi:D-aminoacylase [Roseococcus sp. SYP-B2431]|uniref:N-acyl-D-amino-acid deacylase family protein n=1 Tax=Roseococcus sp. SYP-B2431 TaxID=2496640 RepID=UPI00103BE4DE|nr:amidohydrolase family protein [Roseococcus sp. SYP-B2431]TCH98337.1 D-aminoacylase [Roseococcus sp. SYP-B2431]